MKFRYGDRVQVVEGFHQGRFGTVKSFGFRQGFKTLWRKVYVYVIAIDKDPKEPPPHGIGFFAMGDDLYHFEENEIKSVPKKELTYIRGVRNDET